MTPTLAGILLVVAAAVVESVAQILLKVGAAGGPAVGTTAADTADAVLAPITLYALTLHR